MNEQYLWDKSGPVDSEINELESLLSEFRFQPEARKLEVPASQNRVRFWQKGHFLTVAASLTLMMSSAAILWQVRQAPQEQVHVAQNAAVTAAPLRLGEKYGVNDGSTMKELRSDQTQRPAIAIVRSSGYQSTKAARHRYRYSGSPAIADREEAQRIKAELMLALRVASEKLNMAQQQLGVNKPMGPAS